jgi:hypothetical protein
MKSQNNMKFQRNARLKKKKKTTYITNGQANFVSGGGGPGTGKRR